MGDRAGLRNRVPDAKNAKYFGFTLQFPAAYDQTFYTTTEADRASWVKTIEEASGVRRFGDFYDLREKIGEGRFAEVYRVGIPIFRAVTRSASRRSRGRNTR